ncbi:ORFL60W [Human betaherpesvirus 5]|nr:ORFL60W [Human betaherpesvirus 5]QHX40366.1 ORFL60W [Human betaherpesvirus 5]
MPFSWQRVMPRVTNSIKLSATMQTC